jgi:hypothetical protein
MICSRYYFLGSKRRTVAKPLYKTIELHEATSSMQKLKLMGKDGEFTHTSNKNNTRCGVNL